MLSLADSLFHWRLSRFGLTAEGDTALISTIVHEVQRWCQSCFGLIGESDAAIVSTIAREVQHWCHSCFGFTAESDSAIVCTIAREVQHWCHSCFGFTTESERRGDSLHDSPRGAALVPFMLRLHHRKRRGDSLRGAPMPTGLSLYPCTPPPCRRQRLGAPATGLPHAAHPSPPPPRLRGGLELSRFHRRLAHSLLFLNSRSLWRPLRPLRHVDAEGGEPPALQCHCSPMARRRPMRHLRSRRPPPLLLPPRHSP